MLSAALFRNLAVVDRPVNFLITREMLTIKELNATAIQAVLPLTSEQVTEVIKLLADIKAILPSVQKLLDDTADKEMYTREETRQLLGCSMGTLNNRAKSGELVPMKFGKKCLYKVTEVHSYLEQSRKRKRSLY